MEGNPLQGDKAVALKYADQVLPATRTVLVTGVPKGCTVGDLSSFFSSRCGEIEAVWALDASSGGAKCWCVTFVHRPSVTQATQLGAAAVIKGTQVRVSIFVQEDEMLPEDALTVAVASVIATGVTLAGEAVDGASTFSEKHELATQYAIGE